MPSSPLSRRKRSPVRVQSLAKGQIVNKASLRRVASSSSSSLTAPGSPRTLSTTDSSVGPESDQNVRVAVRVRPLSEDEKITPRKNRMTSKSIESSTPQAWFVDQGCQIVQANARPVEGKSLFAFDAVFDETTSTTALYNSIVGPVTRSVLNGKHGTVFAYGQTGSGKTFTMQGTSESMGIVQMAAHDIFGQIRDSHDRIFKVKVSYIEIYNETVRDLLVSELGKVERTRSRSPTSDELLHVAKLPTLTIRDDPRRGGLSVNAFVKEVSDAKTLVELLQRGNSNRSTASTHQNDRSSRSHAIFRIQLESCPRGEDQMNKEGMVRLSTLNLVDLAGSEKAQRSPNGSRQRESGKINQSLLSLSQVVHALSLPPSKRPQFINYRDSKLTRILQPHLSGNALLAMLCCVSPSKICLEETRQTLRFASRAKMVQTSARVNEVVDHNALILKLRKELLETRKALETMQAQSEETKRVSMEATEEVKKLRDAVTHEADLASRSNKLAELESRSLPILQSAKDPNECETDSVPSRQQSEVDTNSPDISLYTPDIQRDPLSITPIVKEYPQTSPDRNYLHKGSLKRRPRVSLLPVPTRRVSAPPQLPQSVSAQRKRKAVSLSLLSSPTRQESAPTLQQSKPLCRETRIPRFNTRRQSTTKRPESAKRRSESSPPRRSKSVEERPESFNKRSESIVKRLESVYDHPESAPETPYQAKDPVVLATGLQKLETSPLETSASGVTKGSDAESLDQFFRAAHEDNLVSVQPHEGSKFQRVTKRRAQSPGVPIQVLRQEMTLPTEVVVMREGRNVDSVRGDAATNNHVMLGFLENKLEATEDLVESLLKDLESARKCVHELIFRNVHLGRKVEKLTRKLDRALRRPREATPQAVVDNAEVKGKYMLLKISMYLSLLFFCLRLHHLFFASVIFIWLSIEAFV